MKREQQWKAICEELLAYACETAGTSQDLDLELEAAAVEWLIASEA